MADINSNHVLHMNNVYVRAELPIDLGNVATMIDVSGMPYLSSVPLTETASGSVELLIGQDVPEALIPYEVVRGELNFAYAVQTIFGWTVSGSLSGHDMFRSVSAHFIQFESNLEQQLERFWTLDSMPIKHNTLEWSTNDKHVMDMWTATTVLENGHYEAVIPFKPSFHLPDKKEAARARLNRLKLNYRKMSSCTDSIRTTCQIC